MLALALALAALVPPAARAGDEAFGPAPLPRDTVPRIVIDPLEFDWGQVEQGALVEHTFEIRNEGDARLRVLKVKPGCGCATASADESVGAGESGAVKLSIDTTKLRDRVQKGATLYTNDPEYPTIKVMLGGEVLSPVACDPPEPTLSALAGEVTSLELTLGPGVGRPIVIERLSTKFGNLEIGELRDQGDGTYRVMVTMVPLARPAWKREALQVKARIDGERRTIPIPVSIEHRDRIEILPSKRVEFSLEETERLREPGTVLTKEVTIRATPEGGSFRIEGVDLGRLPPEVVATEIETVEAGQAYTVRVKLVSHYDRHQYLSGKIGLVTDLPGHPRRDVLLMARFARSGAGPKR